MKYAIKSIDNGYSAVVMTELDGYPHRMPAACAGWDGRRVTIPQNWKDKPFPFFVEDTEIPTLKKFLDGMLVVSFKKSDDPGKRTLYSICLNRPVHISIMKGKYILDCVEDTDTKMRYFVMYSNDTICVTLQCGVVAEIPLSPDEVSELRKALKEAANK